MTKREHIFVTTVTWVCLTQTWLTLVNSYSRKTSGGCGDIENVRKENAGPENAAAKCGGGICRTGNCETEMRGGKQV